MQRLLVTEVNLNLLESCVYNHFVLWIKDIDTKLHTVKSVIEAHTLIEAHTPLCKKKSSKWCLKMKIELAYLNMMCLKMKILA